MRKDVQRIPKSRDQSERKHTQHNMIEHAKRSVCVFGRESKKLTSGRGTYSSERHVVR
jgi:CO dehydrogenase/acetyl-CoA synthase epsilon subunit